MSDKYLPNLGETPHTDALRDAVHIAVAPVVSDADDYLFPGDPVAFVYGSTSLVKRKLPEYEHADNPPFGVVDPFRREPVRKGERFWALLYPNTITFLRHHWQHPAFDDTARAESSNVSEAEQWLHRFADEWNFDYEEMLRAAVAGDEYIIAVGIDLHSRDELGEDHALFWKYLGELTNRTYSVEHQETVGWSCSC